MAIGVALFFFAPLSEPYLTGSILRRAGGLTALVAAGGAVYAVACLVTGAFKLDDLKLIMKRTRQA